MNFNFRFLVFLFFLSCNIKNKCERTTVDNTMLDSVKRKTDTSYTRRYRNQEFAMAEYYINKKDTTVCQVMKDTADQIRQIIIAKKDKKVFTAEYYSNGQLKAHLSFDSDGKLNGEGQFYFQSGCLKSKGLFRNGLYYSRWENYDQNEKHISTDEYDSSGQLVKTLKRN
jgi:antitoxin component YwqK of YwqJK toxin-antitoxin module